MAKRTAKLVCAMVACVVAVPVVSSAQSADGAADECLSGPKGVAPQGQHWYYRVDRATKRQCWYLREQGERSSQTAAPNVTAAATSPAQKAKPAARPVEDAHAEWPSQQLPRTADPAPTMAPPAAVQPAAAPGPQTASIAPASDANRPQPVVGSRWLDATAASTPAALSPAARALADARNPAKATRRSAATSSPAPAPADPIADTGSGSFQKLLLVMLGALALAGLVVGVVFRFGARYRLRLQNNRPRGRVNWDAAIPGGAAQLTETAAAGGAVRWSDAVNERSAQPIDAALTSEAPMPQPHGEAAAATPSSLAPQAEELLDGDIDRITAMLEQLIKQGPKLDRMVSGPGADGPQAASGARA